MKPAFPFNAIVRAAAMIFAGAAAGMPAQAVQWYTKDAYATPDSVQQIGTMPPPRARWVAPPPIAAAPPPVAAAPPPPPPEAYVPDGHDNDGQSAAAAAGSGGGGGGCFLTTAAVHAMGKADNGEELTMARFLRDKKMTDSKGRSAIDLYYLVGPTIVERKKDWKDFYTWDSPNITDTQLSSRSVFQTLPDSIH